MHINYLTAATVKAILCYIDPVNTPKIAYDRDDLVIPLINKLKEELGDKDGSEPVKLIWEDKEEELRLQFEGVCGNIRKIFTILAGITEISKSGYN